jgi:hypothetical protein
MGSFRHVGQMGLLVLTVVLADLDAQTTRAPARRPPAPPAKPVQAVPEFSCPAELGSGITTKRRFCDVMTAADPSAGAIVTLPPHRGDLTLTFDLHNRHTYSEEQVRAKRAFARYTAGIGVLTMDNTLIARAAIDSEFRTAADLVDRIEAGDPPGAVKAVAPTGTQRVSIVIPEGEDRVSLLGERLTVQRAEGTETFSSPGRAVAVVSNLMIEYVPGPPPKPAPKPRR